MRNLIILFLLSSFLIAQNPKPYATLGDAIYENSGHIEKLKTITEFELFKEKIQMYVVDVNKTKQEGFAIETAKDANDRNAYLVKLRELAKINDFFVRKANNTFDASIINENSSLFEVMIHSGLIDLKKNKSKILNYYLEHSDNINPTGPIQKLLNEDKTPRKEVKLKVRYQAKDVDESKISRIRKNDKLKQEALQKSLEEEVSRKKAQIRQEQIKELETFD